MARYADTKGYVFTQDRRYPFAYTYRDYVIAAFNSDLGYDQFVQQQLAADQIAGGNDRRALAAMGFLTVGRRFLLDQNEIIDDRIDVVSRGFLGLTVTCARCHDHKFDPIPTEDYYSLYGVFASTVEPAELPLLADPAGNPRFVEYQKKLAVATKARDVYLAARRDEFADDMKARLSQYLKAGQSIGFDPRSRKLDELARAGDLNSRRLRGVISMWRRHVSAVDAKDPVFGPWRAFAALPAGQFKAKAAELHRELTAPKDPKAARGSPAGRQGRAGGAAGEHGRRGRAVFGALCAARNALEGKSGEIEAGAAAVAAGSRMGIAASGDFRRQRAAGGQPVTGCGSSSIKASEPGSRS